MMTEESETKTTIRALKNLKTLLKSGITYFRDMGGYNFINIELKKAVTEGLIEGPEFLACGHPLCMTGGHGWFFGRECDGKDDVKKAAREQLKAGADFIKLMATGGYSTPGVHPKSPQLDLEELQAAVEEAHKAGKKAAAHANGIKGIMNAVKAGVDSVEHGEFFEDENDEKIDEILEYMVKNDVYLVPTMSAWFKDYSTQKGYDGPIPDAAIATANAQGIFRTVKKARKAGVKIALGSDSGVPLIYHDQPGYELKLMIKAGLSPEEAIMAATKNASELLGISNKYGTLAEEKQADFIVTNENPVENIDTLLKIERVYKGGKLVLP